MNTAQNQPEQNSEMPQFPRRRVGDIHLEESQTEFYANGEAIGLGSIIRIPLAIILIIAGIFGSAILGGLGANTFGESTFPFFLAIGIGVTSILAIKIIHLVAPYRGPIVKVEVTSDSLIYYPNKDDLTKKFFVVRDGAKSNGILKKTPLLPEGSAKMCGRYDVPEWLKKHDFFNFVSCDVINGRIEFTACRSAGRSTYKQLLVLAKK